MIMPSSCAVLNCNKNAAKDGGIRFFRIPSAIGSNRKVCENSLRRQRAWIHAINLDGWTDKLTTYSRVCSRHFLFGEPAPLSDESHPDWIPSIHMGYNKMNYHNRHDGYERLQKSVQNGVHLTEVENSKNNINKVAQFSYLPNVLEDDQQVYIQTSVLPVKIEEMDPGFALEPEMNYVFEVVPSQQKIEMIQPGIEVIQPSIEMIQPSLRPLFKNDRQKKKKIKATPVVKRKATSPKEQPKVPKLALRTRSGRVVKFPKHIVDDFEKLDTNDKNATEDSEVRTSEFPKFVEPPAKSKPNEIQGLEFHQQRRKISAQYRCPKCQKAYLGKMKMMQHIQKHPDHGPMPQNEKKKVNFDVWNFLVDITQKCPAAQRGAKFCEELTNLLHNLLLLTSALFKKVDRNKNYVEVDKVLGNAIGLSPGPYWFNENELYKDVTVLQLLSTTDFFRPSEAAPEPPVDKEKDVGTVAEPSEETAGQNSSCDKFQKDSMVRHFSKKLEGVRKKSPKKAATTPKLDIVPDDVSIKVETLDIDSEMLSENSILHLSNIRTSVDDLMMTTVDTGGTLLDNSTSSDEVMNVDQFVNERFKRITEPDLEIAGSSLSLDLPSLDLFEFHTS